MLEPLNLTPDLLQIAHQNGAALDVADGRLVLCVFGRTRVAGHAPLTVEVLLLKLPLNLVPNLLLLLTKTLNLYLNPLADEAIYGFLSWGRSPGSGGLVREVIDEVL